jgi:hypothetical protein
MIGPSCGQDGVAAGKQDRVDRRRLRLNYFATATKRYVAMGARSFNRIAALHAYPRRFTGKYAAILTNIAAIGSMMKLLPHPQAGNRNGGGAC